MKCFVSGLLCSLVIALPVQAETARHGHPRHGHIVGTPARHGEPGFPITAASDSIRINAVGEVISQPVPVIEKERNFDARARHDLTTPAGAATPASPAPQP